MEETPKEFEQKAKERLKTKKAKEKGESNELF